MYLEINNLWFKSASKVLSSKPGEIWFFSFSKNWLKSKALKLVTLLPFAWGLISDCEKVSWSFVPYEVTPLNPLTHPVNAVLVFSLYNIISSSICIKPSLSGNWYVPKILWLRSKVTVIVVSWYPTALPNSVSLALLVKASNFKYSSIFWITSAEAPGYSCEV